MNEQMGCPRMSLLAPIEINDQKESPEDQQNVSYQCRIGVMGNPSIGPV